MKKALLINPHKLIPISLSLTQRSSPPLGLAYIAAICESAGFKVEVLDCIAEDSNGAYKFENNNDVLALGISFEQLFKLLKQDNYDLIGITCMFSNNWLINKKLINELKQRFPDAVVMAGGEHITGAAEYCLQDCEGLDLCVMGEGEYTTLDICQHITDGKALHDIEGITYKNRASKEIIFNPRRKRGADIEEIPWPAWHLFPLDKYYEHGISYGIQYGRSIPIFATRGCPFSCTFCSSPDMWTTKYIMRDPYDVIEEIRYLNQEYGITNFDFYDLTAIIKKQWILDFCKLIEENNLDITWQIPAGTRSEAIDYEVATNLYKSGCKNITYAPESGSRRTLKAIKKKVNLSNMLRSIRASKKANLNIKLNIMIGLPDEKIIDILKTFWFLVKAAYYGVEDAAPAIFSPYPGSQLFKELLKEGKVNLNDQYFIQMVYTQSFHKYKNYNHHISKPVLTFLLLCGFGVFYLSSFLFHPFRAVRILKNLITQNYETRGEWMLGEIIKRRKLKSPKLT